MNSRVTTMSTLRQAGATKDGDEVLIIAEYLRERFDVGWASSFSMARELTQELSDKSRLKPHKV
jgi:hypothetical protein